MRYFALAFRTAARTTTQLTQPSETDLAPIAPGAFAAWWARTAPETTPAGQPARTASQPARSAGRASAF